MDLDAYVGARHRAWRRLEVLVARRRLTGAESDELLRLYTEVSTDLSTLRSVNPDPALVRYLSSLLSRARIHTAGSRTGSWAGLADFFTQTFPAALYRIRWWWISTALASVLLAFAMGWYAWANPEVYSALMSPAQIDAYVNTDFENYYSEFPHHEFALLVWTNNAWVAAQCIAFGVLGVPVVYLLRANVENVAVAGALMAEHDRLDLFFGLILPHGLLELTAIFVAGGVGLRLFWSWIEPGPLTRAQSFAQAGRSAVAIALGLVVVLFISGVIEGFVTPSALPTWARISIGAVSLAAFLAYVFVLGRRAVQAGVTGDLARDAAGDQAPVAG
ncbi:MAG: stage II sporulation protein M [Actinomycetia bacterium]|nr:stage II sporulation protein M [Actinomycetes bacterium]